LTQPQYRLSKIFILPNDALDIKVKLKETQRQLAETLWLEIEKAILQSPGVRQSFKKLQASDPKGDPAKYNLSLDIKKLGELIQNDEKSRYDFSVET
jgi:hypothetical protein